MFARRFKLFKRMSFEVGVDASWIIIALKDLLEFLPLKVELDM